MIEILQNFGVDWDDRRLIKNLNTQQSAYVRVGEWKSKACVIGRGVRQGCTLSPLLFNLYDEAMMREAITDVDIRVKVRGYMVKSVRLVNDKAIVEMSEGSTGTNGQHKKGHKGLRDENKCEKDQSNVHISSRRRHGENVYQFTGSGKSETVQVPGKCHN